ncbi:hypothetical protein [Pararhizobium gei]|uniref:hypothetical protein n=1 Tax=Pararhizobium gei TaxID=1395951 RepID=UPI0023DCBB43|nr:hypothetical protein [Rhizobium gei]
MLADSRNTLPFAALLSVLFAALSPVHSAAQTPEKTDGIMAPGPDIEAAVKSEYDRAVRKGTREAYHRFIRRHPDHPLANEARDRLEKDETK